MTGTSPCNCNREECPVCRVFGSHGNEKPLGPSRIIVRDGALVGGWSSEIKYETAIDRKSGSAMSRTLRNTERVAEGAEFRMNIVLQVFDFN